MSLKKYSELSEEEKKKVSVMYADLTDQEQYLYNFDGEKYLGRQYAPPSGKDEKLGLFGTVKAEPLVEETKEHPASRPGVVFTKEQEEKIKELEKKDKVKSIRSRKK